jgi:hypothetical protein
MKMRRRVLIWVEFDLYTVDHRNHRHDYSPLTIIYYRPPDTSRIALVT